MASGAREDVSPRAECLVRETLTQRCALVQKARGQGALARTNPIALPQAFAPRDQTRKQTHERNSAGESSRTETVFPHFLAEGVPTQAQFPCSATLDVLASFQHLLEQGLLNP